MNKNIPKVGFLTLGHIHFKIYCDMENLRKKALQELKQYPIEIVENINILYRSEEIISAVKFLKEEDIDIVILFIPDYFREELIDVIVSEINFCPIALWTLAVSTDILAAPMLGTLVSHSHLMRLNKEFLSVIGFGITKESADKLYKIAKAAMAGRQVSRCKIAQIGASNLGMVVTSINEYAIRKIVPNIIYLDTLELVSLFENIKNKEVINLTNELISKVGKLEVKRDQLEKGIRSYLALRSIIEKYNLDGITIREWPELAGENVTICLAVALLSEEGIGISQESDISCVITSLVQKYCGGKLSYNLDFGSIDASTGISFLFHEGAMPLSFVKNIKNINLTPADTSTGFLDNKEITGVSIEAFGKEGLITASKITANPLNSKIAMLILQGKVIAPPIKEVPKGLSSFYVSFSCNNLNLINTMVKEGMEHHLVISYSQIKEELEYFCEIKGIKKLIPE